MLYFGREEHDRGGKRGGEQYLQYRPYSWHGIYISTYYKPSVSNKKRHTDYARRIPIPPADLAQF